MSKNKIYTLIFCILLTIISIRGYYIYHDPLKNSLKDKVGEVLTISGRIDDEPLIKDFLMTFTLRTEENNFIRVGADKFGEYEYGDKVEVKGKLSAPRNFKSNGGREFDYVNFLGKDGIYYEFKKAQVTILEKRNSKNITGMLFSLKQNFLHNLQKVLGEPHAALAGGLVVGEKAALGKDLINDFRKAGLIHIVVLSGYNITIIAASIRRILSFLPRGPQIILGGIGIILFGILVGGGATVVRSCIMAIIALSGEMLRRDYNVMRALFIAGLLMLLENPLILLYDPSFQLSFLATLGLILLSSPLEKRITFITEKFGMRSLIASTFATQIFVSPYIFYMMGDFSLVGVIVNILVLPFIPLTMGIIFLAGFFGFFIPAVSQMVGWVAHFLLSYEIFMVEFAAKLPFAALSVPKFSPWIVVGCYAFYFLVYLFTFEKFRSIVSQFIFEKKSSI